MKKVIALLLVAAMLSGCAANQAEMDTNSSQEQEVENLEKLCKVWGYTKYTHPAFLVEGKDWDAELISLIPQVQEMNSSEEVNDLLNDWLLSLGEVEFESDTISSVWSSAEEEDIVVVAETDWIYDEEYLGEELSANMIPLTEPIPEINRRTAPINFSRDYYGSYGLTVTMFSNEKEYEDMDYSDDNYRLLGLFRLWNAVEYYNPNIDVIDRDWEDLLPEFIVKMLENSDEQSYRLTLAELAANLQDAHVSFGFKQFLRDEFGEFWIGDAEFVYAEGEVVVVQTFDETCPLQAGDIIRELEGVDMKDRVEQGKKYCAVPDDDKFKNALMLYLLRTHSETPEVTIIRDGQEMTLTVPADDSRIYDTGMRYGVNYQDGTPPSHEIIDGNIGVINPKFVGTSGASTGVNDAHYESIMSNLKNTDGLIIDLRQYPGHDWNVLPQYVYDKPVVGFDLSRYAQAVPGTYVKKPLLTTFGSDHLYDKEIVVLIDEHSQSASEFAALLLSHAANVTLMGENTAGSLGYCQILPLPGGHGVMFTACSSYTPDGELTNRVGVSPDIEVKRTIQGIKEGRDELMEAAIEYLNVK